MKIKPDCSLHCWWDFVRKCFCFDSEAVNASGEVIRQLLKSQVEFTRGRGIWRFCCLPVHKSCQLHRLDDLAHTGGRKHPCTFLLFALNTTNTRYIWCCLLWDIWSQFFGSRNEEGILESKPRFFTHHPGEVLPEKNGWGSVVPFQKSLSYLWPNSAIFPTVLFMTWLLHQNRVSYLPYN